MVLYHSICVKGGSPARFTSSAQSARQLEAIQRRLASAIEAMTAELSEHRTQLDGSGENLLAAGASKLKNSRERMAKVSVTLATLRSRLASLE